MTVKAIQLGKVTAISFEGSESLGVGRLSQGRDKRWRAEGRWTGMWQPLRDDYETKEEALRDLFEEYGKYLMTELGCVTYATHCLNTEDES
jgi:hypothetical protein